MASLKLRNFKCFENTSITLRQLSLLVGYNSVGKSSVIQSLLLLHDALCSKQPRVFINGEHGWGSGYSKDLINDKAQEPTVRISLDRDDVSEFVELESNDPMDLFLMINQKCESSFPSAPIYYLSAERLGPRTSQTLANLYYAYVGPHGENTAQVLLDNNFKKIAVERHYPESKNLYLEHQVNQWLQFIIPGASVTSISSPDTMTARIAVVDNNHPSLNMFATNVGFGISYVLPIIITCLLAEQGSYILIENPEAHLHPAAQSAMGRFLAIMSSFGLNIIVETHSDYVVTGTQLFVVSNPDYRKEVVINFFGRNDIGNVEVKEITMNDKAVLSEWPDGFIDQAARDFRTLENYRRGH